MEEPQTYSREEYATKQFWDDRYKDSETYFDWYAEYPELKQTLEEHYGLQKDDSILMVGCGNSKLSEQMYEAGYSKICNIDISEVVIEQMKKATSQMKMEWLVMDATDLKFSDKTFDCIIDKGTMDAIISGKNLAPCQKMIRELIRVMKKDGQLMLITYGSPEGRKKVYQNSIGLEKYDYYFSKVNLNDTSTLINLMRSNLGGKPLNQITNEKQALAKSVMEFHFVQALRKKRKNQKFIIGWNKIADIKVPAVSDSIFQVANKQQAVQIKAQQLSEKKEGEIVPKKQHNYNPRKQCFVYVYSIRHKFSSDLSQNTQQLRKLTFGQLLSTIKCYKGEDNLGYKFQGRQSQANIILSMQDQQVNKNAALTIKYLENNGASIANVLIEKQFGQKSSWRVCIKKGQKNQIDLIHKPGLIFEVARTQISKMTAFEAFMDYMCKCLTDEENLHPTPEYYKGLQIMSEKLGSSMIQILKKFWYPTWKFEQLEKDKMRVRISLPPIANLSQIDLNLMKRLKSRGYKTIKKIQGFIHIIDPSIITAINLGVLSFCDGQKIDLIAEEFPKESKIEKVPIVSLREHQTNIFAYLFSL